LSTQIVVNLNMHALYIGIGDELLLGQTIETNSNYLALQLKNLGIEFKTKICISDDKTAITDALENGLTNFKLIFITGGLGPTKDDKTKIVLEDYFGGGWRRDSDVEKHLEKIFASKGKSLSDINRHQANLPNNCETLFNPVGTAPGMWFEKNNSIIISLPGVPYEVRSIWENSILTKLSERFNLTPKIYKTLTTMMKPESQISEDLNYFESKLPPQITLAYLPNYHTVKLRLTLLENYSEESFNVYWQDLISSLGPELISTEGLSPIETLTQYLLMNNWKISTAESCTGGYIANELVKQPGISKVFPGSLVTYSNESKNHLLGVSNDSLNKYGAVSEIVATEMIQGLKNRFKTECSIVTTGIAGPSGGTENKSVGSIYIGTRFNDKIEIKYYKLRGDRKEFMKRALQHAIYQLIEMFRRI